MAIIAFTPYNDEDSCLRCNKYIADGHGDAEVRINRYISDGHGGHTQCQGHLCPADPVLATEYMQLLRENYERQHPPRADTRKHPLTHVQFYISPTEEDNVPAAERMEMMQELIDRTVLKDFANLYIPHDNTPNKHGHMSVCPFSVPDEKGKVRKLCLNNNLLYDLRRKMDYICVEHGYSIVENPKLWGDKEYYTWFQEVKASGAVTVHPPREEDLVYYHKEAKLMQDYARSKQKQVEEETRRKALIEEFSTDRGEVNDEYIYIHPYLCDPLYPEKRLQIRRYGADGYHPHDLELSMIALSVWAMSAEQKLEDSYIDESSPLRKSLRELSAKAYRTKQLIHSLDIRTLEELVLHTKECGRDIHELKADIKYQDSLLADMDDMKRQVDRWEYLNDMEAYGYLQEHGCLTPDDISAFQLQYRRILERKEDHEKLLGERSPEYRHLKEAESLLRPAEHQVLWEEYVKTVYTRTEYRIFPPICLCKADPAAEYLLAGTNRVSVYIAYRLST